MRQQGVDLFDDASWSADAPGGHPPARSSHPASRKSLFLAGASGAVVGIALGCLGSFLPSPGGSLVVPTLVVAGIGAAVALLGALFASLVRRPVESVVFACTVVLLTLLATAWTFQLSLPARMALDGSATARARSIAFDATQAMPRRPCTDVTTGSIGPLDAPYRECTWSTLGGHHGVTFTKLDFSAGARRGISFTDLGPPTFLDECYRHLIGPWYMFAGADLANPSSSLCPFGYTFHGGP